MESLWRVLNSNAEYKMTSGMQISFLILSPSHTKKLLQKQSSKKLDKGKLEDLEDRWVANSLID